MAITQLTQLKVRQGLKADLPTLAAGELGWAIDTQELFIGSGTLADGAPSQLNLRVLTQLDSLAAVPYVTSPFYIGEPNTDGSWRAIINGTALSFQRRESGSWVTKGSF